MSYGTGASKWHIRVMLVVGTIGLACHAAPAQSELSASFVTGKATGNLQVAYEKAEIEKEGKQFHLAIRPGGWLQVTFDTTGRRGEVMLELVARTRQPAVYAIEINDETIQSQVEFNFDVYTSTGYDLSRKIIRGKNVATIRVSKDAGGDLWLQEVTVSIGEGGWNPWIVLAFVSVLWIFLSRYIFFPLFWMNGRGMDPIWAMRLTLILIVLGVFGAYMYLFASQGFAAIVIAVALAVFTLLVLLGFTRT